ncbi:adhesin [Salmonella enterica subsp. enterica]|uniref:Adhesin n=1 Tax=Salmonella enterica I TaxID=59201 RepID=A0A447PQF6_SALET|nr:adhesin [Salmonella enterica subsp. enterica]
MTLPEKSGWVGVNATCPAGTTVNYTYRSYVSELPVQSTEGNFKYLKLNDYLLGAMSITDSVAGVFYPPRNYILMASTITCRSKSRLACRTQSWFLN